MGRRLPSRSKLINSLLLGGVLLAGIVFTYLLITVASDSEFVSSVGVGVNAILTILLIIIYYRQNKIIEGQMEVQKEQTRLAKSRYTPYLVGPFDFRYNLSDSEARLKLANSGEGVAQNLTLYVEAEARGDDHDFQIHTYENPMKRSGDNSGDISILHPNEGRVEFRCSPWVGLSEGDTPPGYESLDTMIAHLIEEGVSSFRLGFYVRYKDRFGNEEDPLGREYEVFVFETRTAHSIDVDDVFDSISETSP
ncbi:hypothetical protein [Halobellus rubicundus]|uniref:SMODS-associating 2TM beta-strand rich effector domain-containing protein n=1 Tax=Halobellus rubicundus TaxID=2996466 RepID=A0ABD5MDN8_9EURY